MYSNLLSWFCCFIVIMLMGCTNSTWENIESNYDHKLNVIGIINLDQVNNSDSESFIGVYRTTNLDERSQIFIRADTVGYEYYEEENDENGQEGGFWIIDSIFIPAALINNASVVITNEQGVSTNFSFIEFEYINFDTTLYDTSYFEFGGNTFTMIDTLDIDTTFSTRVNIYKDTTGQFVPEPNMNYTLTINAEGYDTVIGSLVTPKFPKLNDSLILDTLSFLNEYNISWQNSNVKYGLLIEQIVIEPNENYFSTLEKWCYGYKSSVVDLSKNSHTVYPIYCEEHVSNIEPQLALIKLTAMDDNYYDYFVRGDTENYTNISVPNTTKGRSSGLKGGFGFFGAIASDHVFRWMTP